MKRWKNTQRGVCNVFILLMAEILHHLGCMKPYKIYKYWDKLPINWCRISAINSSSYRWPPIQIHSASQKSKKAVETIANPTCPRLPALDFPGSRRGSTRMASAGGSWHRVIDEGYLDDQFGNLIYTPLKLTNRPCKSMVGK